MSQHNTGREKGLVFNWDDEAGDWCDTREGRRFRPFVVATMREQAGVEFNWE